MLVSALASAPLSDSRLLCGLCGAGEEPRGSLIGLHLPGAVALRSVCRPCFILENIRRFLREEEQREQLSCESIALVEDLLERTYTFLRIELQRNATEGER